jgi:signal transduction histidine kinase/DNA-binding response OmpR family regulator
MDGKNFAAREPGGGKHGRGATDKYTRLLLKNTPNIVILMDAEGNVDYCSDVFREMIGPEKYEYIMGGHFREIWKLFGDEQMAEKAELYFSEMKSTGQIMTQNIHVDFSGSGIKDSYMIQRNPLMNEKGVFEGVQLMIFRDSETNELTRVMLDATPMACTLRDEDNNVLDCNTEALRMFGISEKPGCLNLITDFSPEFQPDGSRSAEKSQIILRETREKGYCRFEWMYKTASGEPLPAETTTVRVAWKNGYRIIAYSRDLREIRAQERRTREAEELRREMEIRTKAATAASEAKSGFLASMSHEIRTPMNAIIGLSNLLRTDNLDSEQLSFLSDIKKMSGTLLGIINDILDFSKIETGKMRLTPVHFDLFELYDETVSMTRFIAEEKGLKFTHRFEADVTRIVRGDDLRIKQIIMNLLSNAVKYTREGYVDFRVSRASRSGLEYTSFTVKDTGIGIRKKDMPRMFEQFEQFDPQKNHNVSGTGLGLPITKSLVDMMGGLIEFKSDYGSGSTFTVLLPLPPGERDETYCPECEPFKPDAHPDILVVDDNEINLKVACAYLAKSNITADTAGNGIEAIRKVREKHYDLIFMDHMMPEMDGVEATAHIRTLPDGLCGTTPIIALSANAISGVREFFIQNGMDDYLSKPIDAGKLNKLLSKWLSGKKTKTAQDRKTDAPDAAGRVPSEIDRAAGLRNSANDAQLYHHLMLDCVSDHSSDLAKIDGALKEGDFKSAHRIAHTLKSTASLIGAKRLELAAREAEKELSAHDAVPSPECMENLKNAFEATFRELAALTPEPPRYAQTSAELDEAKALSLIEKLNHMLGSNSTNALGLLEEIRETLAPVGGECEKLANLIGDFEFEKAAEVLSVIKNKILPEPQVKNTGFHSDPLMDESLENM